jgi:hypothetical protein
VCVDSGSQDATANSARRSFTFGLAAAGLIFAALVSLLAGLSIAQTHRGSDFAEWAPFWVMVGFALLSVISLVLSGFHLVIALIQARRGGRLLWLMGSSLTYLFWLAVLWFVTLLGGEV